MLSQVGLEFFIARIITLIFIAVFILGSIGLIPAIVIDVKKKKFHWSKWIIISFICALILFFIINIIGVIYPIKLEGLPPSGDGL